jgi:hypothetical protein
LTVIELKDLEDGAVVPLDAVLREVFLPVYADLDGPPRWIRLTNVPIVALCGGYEE